MDKRITVRLSLGTYADKEPFLIADNESLNLIFDEIENLSDCYVICVNGNVRTSERVSLRKPYTIPSRVCIPGNLIVEVRRISKGMTIRKIIIEPLTICDLGKDTKCFPEVQELKIEVTRLNNALIETEKLLTDLNDRLAIIEQYVQEEIERRES